MKNKTFKTKLLAVMLCFAMCLALTLGVMFASGAKTAFADAEKSYIVKVISDNGNELYVCRAKVGEKITISTSATLSDGSMFDKWEIYSRGITEANIGTIGTLADEKSASTQFTVREKANDNDVYLYALYNKTVQDNTLSFITTVPKAGATPDDCRYYAPHYDTTIWTWKWYRGTAVDESKRMEATDAFEEGKEYTAVYYVKPANDLTIDFVEYVWDDTKEKIVYINGEKAVLTGAVYDDYSAFKRTFTATGAKCKITVITPNGTTINKYDQGANFSLVAPETKADGSKFAWWEVKNDGRAIIDDDEDNETTATVGKLDAVIEAVYIKYADKFSFEVDEPEQGKSPQFIMKNISSAVQTIPLPVVENTWYEVIYDETAGKYTEVKQLVSTDKFEKGKLYQFKWWYIVAEDYTFDNDTKIVLNGSDKTVQLTNNGMFQGRYFIFSTAGNKISVENGQAKIGSEPVTKAEEGKTVTIVAEEKTGQKFARWQVESGEITLANANSPTTTFTMPNNEVSVTAVYNTLINSVEMSVAAPENDAKPDYDTFNRIGDQFDLVNIVWYKGSGAFDSQKMSAEDSFVEGGKYSVAIKVKAQDGYVFNIESDMTTKKINGIAATVITGSGTTEETFKATFTAVNEVMSYNVTLEDGHFEDGATSKTVKENQIIKVVANAAPEGKEFKDWQDASGNIVSKEAEYTFTVTGEVNLKAVYADKPVEPVDTVAPVDPTDPTDPTEPTDPADPAEPTIDKEKPKGLSGGAIAGIVIGSVAVAGVGGFAIFWFAVKKKSFADLIAAIKGIFKKK